MILLLTLLNLFGYAFLLSTIHTALESGWIFWICLSKLATCFPTKSTEQPSTRHWLLFTAALLFKKKKTFDQISFYRFKCWCNKYKIKLIFTQYYKHKSETDENDTSTRLMTAGRTRIDWMRNNIVISLINNIHKYFKITTIQSCTGRTK